MEPMFVILLSAKSMSRASVVTAVTAARGEGAEVEQQGPAAEATGAGMLMAMQPTTGVQQAGQAVHQAVHQVAGAVAARMGVGDLILRRSLPQLGHHVANRSRPRT